MPDSGRRAPLLLLDPAVLPPGKGAGRCRAGARGGTGTGHVCRRAVGGAAAGHARRRGTGLARRGPAPSPVSSWPVRLPCRSWDQQETKDDVDSSESSHSRSERGRTLGFSLARDSRSSRHRGGTLLHPELMAAGSFLMSGYLDPNHRNISIHVLVCTLSMDNQKVNQIKIILPRNIQTPRAGLIVNHFLGSTRFTSATVTLPKGFLLGLPAHTFHCCHWTSPLFSFG